MAKKEIKEAGEQGEVSVKISPLQSKLAELNKTYGANTVIMLNDKLQGEYDIISTGSIAFDFGVLGIGGMARGKLYELRGWEGCLAKDTYVKFIVINPETQKVQDCKGSTIENLYKRFHKLKKYGNYEKTLNSNFYVTSVNEDNKIIRNLIADVVKTGEKECFEVTSKTGFKLKATKDHKFFNGIDYVPLEKLNIGDCIYIHNNTPYKYDSLAKRICNKEIPVNSYYKGKRTYNGKTYYRATIHHITFEAYKNGVSVEDYINILNNSKVYPTNLWRVPSGFEIHHKNENVLDNSIENLELLSKFEHAKLHALKRHNNLRFIAVKDEILSINSVGVEETYDIKCFQPYNNFIANGFVVHNSGKTTICGHLCAEAQKKNLQVLYIDGEYALDKDYFAMLGVDVDKLIINQPNDGIEGFTVALELIKTGEIGLVIIDSDSSLLPKDSLDNEVGASNMGKKAKLNSDVYPKLKIALSQTNTCVIVTSQYREKMGVMFGDPKTTQGGKALGFYADTIIELSKKLKKEDDEVVANIVTMKTIKNKTYNPFKKADADILYGVGIDKIGEILKLGTEKEIFKKWGKQITYGVTKYEINDFVKLLLDNEAFFAEIKAKIIETYQN